MSLIPEAHLPPVFAPSPSREENERLAELMAAVRAAANGDQSWCRRLAPAHADALCCVVERLNYLEQSLEVLCSLEQ